MFWFVHGNTGYTCRSSVIINRNPFHSQKCSGLDNKLYIFTTY